MKKTLTILSILALTFAMNINAFATADTSSTTPKWETRINARIAELEAKKNAISDFRTAVLAKREIVQQNRDDNKAIWEENKTLRTQLKTKLEAIKAAGTVLDPTIIQTLKDDNAKIKTLREEIKSTSGQIKAILVANKENRRKLDYAALDASFKQIADIQLLRNAKLVEINGLLETMLGLLN
jgi:chromosome segregation ATPase